MKFNVKFTDGNYQWWEDFDHPTVTTNPEAFHYALTLTASWNSVLGIGEFPRRVLNARITGSGRTGTLTPNTSLTSLEIH